MLAGWVASDAVRAITGEDVDEHVPPAALNLGFLLGGEAGLSRHGFSAVDMDAAAGPLHKITLEPFRNHKLANG
jgi:hypothetical protein